MAKTNSVRHRRENITERDRLIDAANGRKAKGSHWKKRKHEPLINTQGGYDGILGSETRKIHPGSLIDAHLASLQPGDIVEIEY